MTLDQAVQYIETLGHSVTQLKHRQLYVIRTSTGKVVTPIPVTQRTVIANAIAWKNSSNLRPIS